MYLLTFSFLIIGMLAIYAQVVAVEATRLYESQSGIAQSMIYWHEAALSLANSIINPYPTLASGGCSLTSGVGTACTHSALVAGPAAVTVNGGTYSIGGISYPFLPVGYSTANYPWKSIVFQNGGSYYVLTYVDPPASPASGFINTATGTQMGITQSDMFQQIVNTGLSNLAYGYVNTTATLITSGTFGGTHVTYAVPSSPTVKAGSLGIISYTTPCGSC